MKSKIGNFTITVLFILALAALAGWVTAMIVYAQVMKDFKQPTTGYTTLEVKENYANQTDNHYKLQPAKQVQRQ